MWSEVKAHEPATAHQRDRAMFVDIELTTEDLHELDQAFPPPTRKTPLEMI